jgi:iron complex outermembrane recepter protein
MRAALAAAVLSAVTTLPIGMRAARADDTAPASAEPTSLEAITVTARKRDESLATVPVSITVFTGEALASYNIQSFNDYATKTPNVSFSYGGGPTGIADARTVAIRGITGQNLFGTSGATGFYIDDTPVPGSVDPRVLDIDNIEVLKGPQGTLFGESSLGGNVRLITRRPNLDKDEFTVTADAGLTSGGGSLDGGSSVIANVSLVPDKLALRIVLFANHDAGYLTRTFPDPSSPAVTDPNLSVPRTSVGNQGAVTTYGGSLSTLLKVSDDFEARLRVMFQNTTDNGFPALSRRCRLSHRYTPSTGRSMCSHMPPMFGLCRRSTSTTRAKAGRSSRRRASSTAIRRTSRIPHTARSRC